MENCIFNHSKLEKIFDFHQVDYTRAIESFEIDQNRLEKDLQLMRKRHMKKINAIKIEAGDYVLLNSHSLEKRFQKSNITVIVGKGMFHKELELSLIGLEVGNKKTIVIDDHQVNIEILKIDRMVLPVLDDEDIQKWEITNVSSYQELNDYLINEQFQDYLEDTISNVSMYVENESIQRSIFDLDPLDIKRQKQIGHAVALDFMKSNGLDVDHMSDDDVWEDLQVTKSQYIDYVENLYVNEFKASMLGYYFMKNNEKYSDVDMTEENCRNYYFDHIKEYITQRIKEEMSR